jgi:hypothetical protein
MQENALADPFDDVAPEASGHVRPRSAASYPSPCRRNENSDD